MTTAQIASRTPVAVGRILRNTLAAGIAAALANVAVLAIGNAAIDGSVQVTDGPGSSTYTDLTLVQGAISTLVSAALAGVLYLVLARLAPARARTIFIAVAGVALLVSFGGPLGLDIPGEQQLILSVMHVVAAAIIVPVIARARR